MEAKWPVILLLILICIPFFSPCCSGKVLSPEKNVITYHDVFEGENENLKAKFVLNESHVLITSNNKTGYYGTYDQRLFITYRGNLSGPSTPKKINISYKAYFPYDRGSMKFNQVCDFDIDKNEYTLNHYNTCYRESSTNVQGSVSTQKICSIKDEWTNPWIQILRSGDFSNYSFNVSSAMSYSDYYRRRGFSKYPHVIYKSPGHCLVIWHTIDFYPYKTVYTHHEGMGGTEVDKNKNVTVTVELDGLVETLELKSMLRPVTLKPHQNIILPFYLQRNILIVNNDLEYQQIQSK